MATRPIPGPTIHFGKNTYVFPTAKIKALESVQPSELRNKFVATPLGVVTMDAEARDKLAEFGPWWNLRAPRTPEEGPAALNEIHVRSGQCYLAVSDWANVDPDRTNPVWRMGTLTPIGAFCELSDEPAIKAAVAGTKISAMPIVVVLK